MTSASKESYQIFKGMLRTLIVANLLRMSCSSQTCPSIPSADARGVTMRKLSKTSLRMIYVCKMEASQRLTHDTDIHTVGNAYSRG